MKEKLSKLAGNYNTSRIMALVLSLLLCISVIGIIASAASVTKDGLEATLTTDKEEYSSSEPIVATLSVENKGNTIIDEMNLETLIPDGYHIESKATAKKNVGQIDVGEKAVLSVTLLPNSNTTPETPVIPGSVTPIAPSEDGTASSNSNTNKQGNGENGNSKSSSTISPVNKPTSNTPNTLGVVSTKATTRPTTQRNVGIAYQNKTTANTDSKVASVNTGDKSTLWIWLGLAIMAGVGLLVLLYFGKAKKGLRLLSLFVAVSLFLSIFESIAVVVKADKINNLEVIAVHVEVSCDKSPLMIQSTVSYSDCNSSDYFVCLEEGCTSIVVKDEKSAREALETVSDYIGINDPSSELVLSGLEEIDNDSFYKFQQYYDGIPVFGKYVNLLVEEDGTVGTITSNCSPIHNLDIESNYDKSSVVIVDETVCNKSFEEREDGVYLILRDIDTNKIIEERCCTIPEEYVRQTEDGNYLLEDVTRNIKMFDVHKKLLHQYISLGSKSGQYEWLYYLGTELDAKNDEDQKELWKKEAQANKTEWSTIYHSEVMERIHSYFGKDIDFISSKDEYGFDSRALDVMKKVEQTNDYYWDVLNRKGYDNHQSRMFVTYNDAFDSGKNSYSCFGAQLGFGYDESISFDLVGHEYTHSVEHTISAMDYSGESGALMEAYSDIFGELVEAYYNNGNADWIHGERNMIDPEKNGHPKRYLDSNWKPSYETIDHGNVHHNSTAFSHAAYLMNNGIDGEEEWKIDNNDLAKIWYRSFYLLPEKATFSDAAKAVYQAAYHMGGLSAKQIYCIVRAFVDVKIPYCDEPSFYIAAKGQTLLAQDKEQKYLENYHLSIENPQTGKTVYDGNVNAANPYIINLNYGNYTFKIRENQNSAKSDDFDVRVTDFETPEKLILRTNILSTPPGDISGIDDPEPTQNNNGHYYKVFDDDLTWDEAKSICESYGGHLVTITSQKENDIVSDLIKNVSMGAYWIGAQRDDNWKWITGEDFTYSSWQPNRPDNNEQGMVIQIFNNNVYENQLGLWDDTWTDGDHAAGLREQGYVCEWDSKQAYDNGFGFASGSGTEEDPYVITTPAELNHVRHHLSSSFILGNDIDMAAWNTWEPIGKSEYEKDFAGVFDGNNKTIKNLHLGKNADKESNHALFGEVSGTLKNIIIDNLSITINHEELIHDGEIENWYQLVGGLLLHGGNIDNCKVSGNITVSSLTTPVIEGGAGLSIGGISAGSSNIRNCESNVNIRVTKIEKDISISAGGISGDGGVIYNCINKGTISTENLFYGMLGGIVGEGFWSKITSCSNYGDIKNTLSDISLKEEYLYGEFLNVGGIAGRTGTAYDVETIISNCYNYASCVQNDGSSTRVGRIFGDWNGPDENSLEISNNFSVKSTLVNGVIPTEDIAANQKNGANL